MKYIKNLIFLLAIISSQILYAQTTKLDVGIGATHFSWSENQLTTDLNLQLSIQKKQSTRKFFIALKAFGNAQRSVINKFNYTFVEPVRNNYLSLLNANEELFSNYRGSEAEVGFMWNQKLTKKPSLYPILSIFSKSIARKISSNTYHHVEEEKYSLHGINLGAGVHIPGKIETHFQFQIFEPILRDITVYGLFIGVPYSSSNIDNDLFYRAKLEFKKDKIGALISYEILNLGAAKNKDSKTILASQANSLSISLQYEF